MVVGRDRFSETVERDLGIGGHGKNDPLIEPPQKADLHKPRRSSAKVARGFRNVFQ